MVAGRAVRLCAALSMAMALGIGVAGPVGASVQQPSVDPTQVVPPGPGVTPDQAARNAQIQTARARLAVTSRQSHPGKTEAATDPQLTHAGSGLATLPHPQVAAPNAAVGPSSTASLPGLDVSGYQGNVDWAQVSANGAQFAYVKATEGTYFTSSYFAQQFNGSSQQGLVRGAYHFGIPSNSSGAAQADFFVSNGGAWSADNQTLPGALDIEYNPYGSECYGITQPQMVDWINAFVNEYHALTSRWAAIYSTTDWLTTCTGNSASFGADDPLWIANYNGTPNPLPAGWSSYAFWQYADHGTFPGDQDTFNGSHDQLVYLADNGPTNCTIYSSPGTGSHQVCGAIRDKYLALGGPAGFLGYPTTDELATPDGTGRFNHFSNSASIYWTPSTGAWSIHGAIRDKWASMGWERSLLGYPVTDETGTPDGVGRFNHFSSSGSIYWTPGTGAWSVHGAIRAKWASLGWETSFLGYPVTDETGTPDGIGRFNHFAKSGSVYWTPSTGAWSVHGAIRATWASLGWERSCLGYPVSDEFAISGGRQSNFQHGFITWNASTGATRSSCS
jgi:GH25 family lysozyme M1 (1,4-beta-N-acetylmuramidase)